MFLPPSILFTKQFCCWKLTSLDWILLLRVRGGRVSAFTLHVVSEVSVYLGYTQTNPVLTPVLLCPGH